MARTFLAPRSPWRFFLPVGCCRSTTGSAATPGRRFGDAQVCRIAKSDVRCIVFDAVAIECELSIALARGQSASEPPPRRTPPKERPPDHQREDSPTLTCSASRTRDALKPSRLAEARPPVPQQNPLRTIHPYPRRHSRARSPPHAHLNAHEAQHPSATSERELASDESSRISPTLAVHVRRRRHRPGCDARDGSGDTCVGVLIAPA